MKSRAFVLREFGQPLEEEMIDIPSLREGEVLVRIKAAGVCGSDIHIWQGEDPRTPLPLILGHEGVGEVVESAGEKLTVEGELLRPGDLVFWNRGVTCGHCYHCSVLKEPSLCTNRRVLGINISRDEPPYLNGCYSEYVILAEGTDIFKVPPGVEPATLVSASCSGATAAHAFDLLSPGPGDTVVVVGPGPLGLFSVAFARAHGARNIILIGGSEVRLKIGKELGATQVLDRNHTTREYRRQLVLEITGGRGADLVIEAVGSPEGLRESIDHARAGATVLVTGFGQPAGSIQFDGYYDLAKRNLRLQGVWTSDTRHVYQALNLVLQQPELFSKMITHHLPLSEANTALEIMRKREAVKAVLVP